MSFRAAPLCGVLLALAASAQEASDAPSDEERAFLAALDEAHDDLADGRPDQALPRLQVALAEHGDAEWVLARLVEVREALAWCAFLAQLEPPEPEDVVKGELAKYDPRRGKIALVHDAEEGTFPGDFERVGPGGIWSHPVHFAGPFSIEVTGRPAKPSTLGGGFAGGFRLEAATFVAWTDPPADWYAAVFGHERVEGPFSVVRIPARIVNGATDEALAEKDPSPVEADEEARLEMRVTSSQIVLYHDGKKLLSAKRSAKDTYGRVAFGGLEDVRRVELRGEANVSWIEGAIQARVDDAWAEFRSEFDTTAALPADLRARVEAPPDAGSMRVSRASAESLERATRALGEGDAARAAEALSAALEAEEDSPALLTLLARARLFEGRVEEAEGVLRRALRGGAPVAELEPTASILHRLRRGPLRRRTFEHASRNYRVQSDIDESLCFEAAQLLEESLRIYQYRLGRLPKDARGDERFAVHLFAGRTGYTAYTADLFGEPATGSAGLYSPVLRQLLIWNLPDRDDMRRTIRHEGFHQYLHARLGRNDVPVHLNEGLAEYFETARIAGGAPADGDPVAAHLETLAEATWIPFREFLEIERGRFYRSARLTYAQAWALVHFLLQGDEGGERRLVEALDLLAQGGDAAAVRELLLDGRRPDELERAVRAHVADL